MTHDHPGPLPSRWLNCPRKSSKLICDKFLAFKTPLGSQFNRSVPEANRFTPGMLFDTMRDLKKKLVLWIDLTKTSRFYDKREIEKMGCKYIKIACQGQGATPSKKQTCLFIDVVSKLIDTDSVIGVHCTHGFNRTGFLLVSYMVEKFDYSVDKAIDVFASNRPPGIYKQDYINELYGRYDNEIPVPNAPERPAWCLEEEEIAPSVSETTHQNYQPSAKKRRREANILKDVFMPGVDGVEPLHTQPRLREVQNKAQRFCKWVNTGFPGSQPVSMDMENINLLSTDPYRVSWKADGIRYMLLIEDENEVFMIDRDNCVFKVNGLRFPHNSENRHLRDTLLDGEMVIDTVNNTKIFRYLCYDIIRFDNINLGKEMFYPTRLNCIYDEIIRPRNRAITNGVINKNAEPFRVVNKEFWDVSLAGYLLKDKFVSSLRHEPDGLIFQPSKEEYISGPCKNVLKWKPNEMNSIDFRLKIVTETGLGILPTSVALLYVGQRDAPYGRIKYTKGLNKYNNKIVECRFDIRSNTWVIMRERTDKSYPNSYKTAQAVHKSIINPVTKEYLLSLIAKRNHGSSHHTPSSNTLHC